MKKLKKLFALMLAMMMLLAMGSTAMASSSEPPAQATTGSITIKDSEEGTTYKLYKIFGLSIQDGAIKVVTYSMTEDWKDFFASNSGKEFISDTNDGNLNPIDIDGVTKYINITGDNIVEFTDQAMKYAEGISEETSDIGTGEDLEVAGLELGYYLIVPVNASQLTANSGGSVASITSTTPDAEVYVKAVKPSVEKEDNLESAFIGEKVEYLIRGVVPVTEGYWNEYVYKITDEMSNGLTFQKDVKLTIGGAEVEFEDRTNISCSYTNNGFVFIFDTQELEEGFVGKEFILTYSAIVNENAVKSDNEKNSVTLEYGHINETETITLREEVYSSKITINKEVTGTDTKLAGAKFVLMNSEGKYYKYTAANGDTPASVTFVEVSGAPNFETDKVSDTMATALKDAVKAGTITSYETDDNGAAVFNGLADGDYYLVEYEAPTGYNRLESPQAAELEGLNVDTDENSKEENKADATNLFDKANNVTVNVDNNKGGLLPGTGSIGTIIFYAVGGTLVVAATVLLITRKRMGVEK